MGGGRGRDFSRLIRSVLIHWRLDWFFLSHCKGPSSQDQQKTIERRLITSKVTLTGRSHFMLIFVLRKVTLPNRINYVSWMNAVTSTPYHECTQLVHKILCLNWIKVNKLHSFMVRSWCDLVKSWYGVDVTVFIHGRELMRFGIGLLWFRKVTLYVVSPVKVTLEVIKWCLMVFCRSCDEDPLKWDF